MKFPFGREPATWAALIQAAIALGGPLLFHWSVEQTAVVYAVAVAVLDTIVAYQSKETMLAVVIGLTKALIAAGIAFGGHIDAATTAQIIALVTAGIGILQRTQTSHLDAGGNFDLAA